MLGIMESELILTLLMMEVDKHILVWCICPEELYEQLFCLLYFWSIRLIKENLKFGVDKPQPQDTSTLLVKLLLCILIQHFGRWWRSSGIIIKENTGRFLIYVF